MVDDEILDWMRRVHQITTWAASVCTGTLIGRGCHFERIVGDSLVDEPLVQDGRAANHGRKAQADKRIVQARKVVTAAGVSAWIDLALWLPGQIGS